MDNEIQSADPDVWLVELTNEQMATFWSVTEGYEEGCLGDYDEEWEEPDDYPEDRAELRSLQAAVEQARPIWEQQTITYQESEQ